MIIKKAEARKIVRKIVDDLGDRDRLGDAWGHIDGLTKDEIIDEWTDLLMVGVSNAQ